MMQPGEHNGKPGGKFKLGCVLLALAILAAVIIVIAFLNGFYGAMGRGFK